jgi:hypothetical protein
MVCGRQYEIEGQKGKYGMWVIPVIAVALRIDSHSMQNFEPVICEGDGFMGECDRVSNERFVYPSVGALHRAVNSDIPEIVELLGDTPAIAAELRGLGWKQRG